MKNRKLTLLALALFLSLALSACAGNAPMDGTSSDEIKTSTVVSTAPEGDDDDYKPVEPRITYSSSSPTEYNSLYAGRKELAYDTFTDDIAYEAAAEPPARAAADSVKGVTGSVSAAAPVEVGSGAIIPDGGEKKLPDDEIIELPEVSELPEIEPQVGLLTAGEWKDNENWGFFTNLVNSQRITFPSFGIDPRYRVKVDVLSSDKQPVVNARVELLDKDEKVLWSAVTDKQGVAYLFDDMKGAGSTIQVSDGSKTEKYPLELDVPMPVTEVDPQSQQHNNNFMDAKMDVTFDGENKLYKNLDLMFIVDATGSMSDEMAFLQKEFTAITEDAGDDDTRYSVNFYRDEGDEYVTKCYDFTKNVKDLQTHLNSESANEGGDIPEAVDRILEESILNSKWSDESVKLAFMILDAPPHEGTEESLIKSIKAAAEKGIRLIPVVSSNSEREIELFCRACAITTGGTYVFLTDDSGVGYSHLEPIIGEYKVEKLYDLIIRVINEYKQ